MIGSVEDPTIYKACKSEPIMVNTHTYVYLVWAAMLTSPLCYMPVPIKPLWYINWNSMSDDEWWYRIDKLISKHIWTRARSAR